MTQGAVRIPGSPRKHTDRPGIAPRGILWCLEAVGSADLSCLAIRPIDDNRRIAGTFTMFAGCPQDRDSRPSALGAGDIPDDRSTRGIPENRVGPVPWIR